MAKIIIKLTKKCYHHTPICSCSYFSISKQTFQYWCRLNSFKINNLPLTALILFPIICLATKAAISVVCFWSLASYLENEKENENSVEDKHKMILLWFYFPINGCKVARIYSLENIITSRLFTQIIKGNTKLKLEIIRKWRCREL